MPCPSRSQIDSETISDSSLAGRCMSEMHESRKAGYCRQ